MESTIKKSRIEWVDYVRAFAILLVMIGHSGAPTPLEQFVYLFHIPLFFFISGYVFRKNRYESFKSILKAKVRTLLIPAICLGLIDALISSVLNGDLRLFLFRFPGAFIQLRGSYFESGLWFLVCLFTTELTYWLICKCCKSKIFISVFLIFMMVIGIGYKLFINRICPWSLEVMFIAIGFFGVGNLLKGTICFEKITKWYGIVVAVILLSIVFLINRVFGYSVDMYANNYGNFLLFYLGAFSGIIASIGFFKKMKNLDVMLWLGQNTLTYYAFHKSIYAVFITISGINYWLVIIAIAIVMLIPVSLLINRFVPFLVGKNR